MNLSNYPTIIENLDAVNSIVINSNADPSMAPDGKASITILTLGSYNDFSERGTEDYRRKKKEFAEKLVKKAIPNLSKYIMSKIRQRRRRLKDTLLCPREAIYAFDQSIHTKRPYFKTPKLTSTSTFPGGGIEAVVISGAIWANDICGWEICTYR